MPSDAPAGARGPAGETVLAARGLRKSFGSREVLRDVDLDLRRGTVTVLIGPSGSGKTTVLRSLNGLETPDAGTIDAVSPAGPPLHVDFAAGISPKQRRALRDVSGMVFQQHSLFPHLSVLENVIEGPVHVQRVPRPVAIAKAEALLDRVGLAEHRDARPAELSGGQQQRVGIVRALALEPALLLFDEPTSALDPELVGEVLRVMQELARERWTMAVVTHELAFARAVADEVLFLDGGVIVERGTPAEVFGKPREARTRRFLARLEHPLD